MGSSHRPCKAAGGGTLDCIRVISGCKRVLSGPLAPHAIPFALGLCPHPPPPVIDGWSCESLDCRCAVSDRPKKNLF